MSDIDKKTPAGWPGRGGTERDLSYDTQAENAITLWKIREAVEVGLCRRIAASHKWLGGAAIQCGVTPEHFDCPDLKLLATPLLEPGDWPLIARLKAARQLLKDAHLWDDGVPYHSKNMHWSDARLSYFATRDLGGIEEVVGLSFALLTLNKILTGGRK